MSFPSSTKWSVISLVFLVSIFVIPLTWANHESKKQLNIPGLIWEVQANEASASAIATPSATLCCDVAADTGDAEAYEDIDTYIRTIFGKDGEVAIAVNRVECNPQNKQYPKCVYHTENEYSVGIFQINLYNKDHWIHAKKVPGDTMEEKVNPKDIPF